MSKRAEQAALKAYPIQGEWVGNQYGGWDSDINSPKRNAFQKGYEQAEKDTIERACEWLFRHYAVNLFEFRKAMEEE